MTAVVKTLSSAQTDIRTRYFTKVVAGSVIRMSSTKDHRVFKDLAQVQAKESLLPLPPWELSEYHRLSHQIKGCTPVLRAGIILADVGIIRFTLTVRKNKIIA